MKPGSLVQSPPQPTYEAHLLRVMTPARKLDLTLMGSNCIRKVLNIPLKGILLYNVFPESQGGKTLEKYVYSTLVWTF